jgi:DnaK suppressor protein
MNDLVTGRPLSAAQLTMFAAQLAQQRRFRTDQIQQYEVRGLTHPSAQTSAAREVSDTILGGARLALAEIEAAQRRLADASFGRCVDCADQVPIERLEVLPYVARCLGCDRARSLH